MNNEIKPYNDKDNIQNPPQTEAPKWIVLDQHGEYAVEAVFGRDIGNGFCF